MEEETYDSAEAEGFERAYAAQAAQAEDEDEAVMVAVVAVVAAAEACEPNVWVLSGVRSVFGCVFD